MHVDIQTLVCVHGNLTHAMCSINILRALFNQALCAFNQSRCTVQSLRIFQSISVHCLFNDGAFFNHIDALFNLCVQCIVQ